MVEDKMKTCRGGVFITKILTLIIKPSRSFLMCVAQIKIF